VIGPNFAHAFTRAFTLQRARSFIDQQNAKWFCKYFLLTPWYVLRISSTFDSTKFFVFLLSFDGGGAGGWHFM
jgi:hypothetical protein